MAYWYTQTADPGFREGIWRRIAETFGNELVGFEFELRAVRSENRSLLREVGRLGREGAGARCNEGVYVVEGNVTSPSNEDAGSEADGPKR